MFIPGTAAAFGQSSDFNTFPVCRLLLLQQIQIRHTRTTTTITTISGIATTTMMMMMVMMGTTTNTTWIWL
jgi:hypothetical protein